MKIKMGFFEKLQIETSTEVLEIFVGSCEEIHTKKRPLKTYEKEVDKNVRQ